MKLFVVFFSSQVSGTALHSHFDTHLIYSDKCFPIFNSEIDMALGKLKTTHFIEFLKEGSASGYSMIVAQVYNGLFELCNTNVKLKVLNNGHD